MTYLQDVYAANLNAVCHLGGAFTLQTGGEWGYREHTFVQNKFYYILEGNCRITIEGKEYIGEAGSWFFIPAGVRQKYSDIPGEPLKKYWIHFDLYPNAELAKLLSLPYVVTVGKDDPSRETFRRLVEANESDRLTDRLNAKAYLLQLIARYVELASPDAVLVGNRDEERLQDLLAYIHEHLDEHLGNDEMAAHCHMHPTHFIRYFRGKTGQTPARYVTERRMESAKRMLEESTLTVAEIMERVGFEEPSHFARLFRKHYALSPTEYRRKYRREIEFSTR